MLADFAGSWFVEVICKKLFADLEPKPLVTRGRERREARRAEEERKMKQEELLRLEKEEEDKVAAVEKLESKKTR